MSDRDDIDLERLVIDMEFSIYGGPAPERGPACAPPDGYLDHPTGTVSNELVIDGVLMSYVRVVNPPGQTPRVSYELRPVAGSSTSES